MKSIASTLLPMIVLCMFGCSTPQISHGPSNLSLGLLMVPTEDGKQVYPAVMLVGDGMLLVERCSDWTLIGSTSDGEAFFTRSEEQYTDSFKPRLIANYAIDALPEVTQGMGWSVNDPVWFGPKYDADLVERLELTTIRCHFSYLSRDYRLVEARFDWQIHPQRDPADSLNSILN